MKLYITYSDIVYKQYVINVTIYITNYIKCWFICQIKVKYLNNISKVCFANQYRINIKLT